MSIKGKFRRFLLRLAQGRLSALDRKRGFVELEFIRQRIPSLSKVNPIRDYLSNYSKTVEPSKFFNYKFYRGCVGFEVENPFEHYLAVGEAQGLKPGPEFDPKFYLEKYPDTASLSIGPLEHFIKHGFWEGRHPRAIDDRIPTIIDNEWLRGLASSQAPPEAVEMLNFYLFSDRPEVSPCPEFDSKFYSAQLEGRVPVASLLEDYLERGELENIRPSLQFDPYFYREAHLICRPEESPLFHYRKIGKFRALPTEFPASTVDLVTLPGRTDNKTLTPEQRVESYFTKGWSIADPNEYFSLNHYLRQFPNILLERKNPLTHYLIYGEPRGATPSERFDPDWYYERYPDIKNSGISALAHYLQYGAKEHRTPAPPPALKRHDQIVHAMQIAGCSVRPSNVTLRLPSCGISDLEVEPVYSQKIGLSKYDGSISRTVSIFRIRNCVVAGNTRFVVDKSNAIAHDEAQLLRGPHIRHEKFPGAYRTGDAFTLTVGIRPGRKIDCGIHMMHEYDNNYFHFVSEILPRLVILNNAGVPKHVPLLVSSGLHRNLFELLKKMNRDERPIMQLEHGVLHDIDDMYYVGDCSIVVDAYDGGEFARASQIDTENIKNAITSINFKQNFHGAKKIFATRNSRHRALVNQESIADSLVSDGFEIIDCANMTIDEQASAFRGAELIIAPTGAQLTNIVWCQPGCKVIVLASDHPSHQLYLWRLLGQVSGASVSSILGKSILLNGSRPDVHSDYEIDASVIPRKN